MTDKPDDTLSNTKNAALILADGAVFFGQGIGAQGIVTGEICFNTGMTGYQETLTDPSYAKQVITFTFPHIGNTGCNAEDMESDKVYASGLIVREIPTPPSNYRSEQSLQNWLEAQGVTGIAEVDTRAIVRHVRNKGAQNVAIMHAESAEKLDIEKAKELLKLTPDMKGMELAGEVSTSEPYEWSEGRWVWNEGYSDAGDLPYHVVAIDYGIKRNILRSLTAVGCRVTVVPSNTPAQEILAKKPDGVFLSNGPGDPAATGEYAKDIIKEIVDANIPVFGICLGHQLLATTLGAKTEKMQRGHRGANQPVQNKETGIVEITSQNHGFVVTRKSLPKGVSETHTSLFDGTIEGIKLDGKPVYSVQHHPEASPGPQDSYYLFEQFVENMKARKGEAEAA